MTETVILSVCVALHASATAVLIGQYLVFALVILPALQSRLEPAARAKMVAAMMKQARPWEYAALGVFILTGILMLIVHPAYLGFMDFSNTWSILMLIKHVLVTGLIALGTYLDQGVTRKLEAARSEEAGALLRRFRNVNGMLILGGLAILYLTALAQSL